MVVYTCNLSTWKAEVRGWRIRIQHGLYNETLSQYKIFLKSVCACVCVCVCVCMCIPFQ
jgi:hypothetical protein